MDIILESIGMSLRAALVEANRDKRKIIAFELSPGEVRELKKHDGNSLTFDPVASEFKGPNPMYFMGVRIKELDSE